MAFTYGTLRFDDGGKLWQEVIINGTPYWLQEGDPIANLQGDEFEQALIARGANEAAAGGNTTAPVGGPPAPPAFGAKDVLTAPEGWDPAGYLYMNPDVAADPYFGQQDPLKHYWSSGKDEGRTWIVPKPGSSGVDSMAGIKADFDAQMAKWNQMNAEMAAQIAAMQNYKFEMPKWEMPEFPTAPKGPEVAVAPERKKSRIRALTLLTSGAEQGVQATKLGAGSQVNNAKAAKRLLG